LYRTPVSKWVARFVGEANFVPGRLSGEAGRVDTTLGQVTISGASLTDQSGEEQVDVLVRPEQVTLSPGDTAEITAVEYYGHDVRYELLLADGTVLSARTHPDVLRQRGDRVAIAFDGSTSTAFVD
jgi:iron(III) transport system ATP-binding protein